MTDTIEEIQAATKGYIMKEFLPGEDADELSSATPLLSGGILDSISTVKLIGFLEDKYKVEFAAHEVSEDHIDSLEAIAALVLEKLSAG